MDISLSMSIMTNSLRDFGFEIDWNGWRQYVSVFISRAYNKNNVICMLYTRGNHFLNL